MELIPEHVTLEMLPSVREACYRAFRENIDRCSSVEESVRVITESPRKKIQRYWKRALFIRQDGEVIAGLNPVPFDIRVNGKRVPGSGIGDVFCIRKGTDSIRRLFSRYFEDASSDAFSVLMPFSDSYYARYGYVRSGLFERITFPRSHADRIYPGTATSLRKAGEADEKRLGELYEEAASGINLMAYRTDPLDFRQNRFALTDAGYLAWQYGEEKVRVTEIHGVSLDDMFAFFRNECPDFKALVLDDAFQYDFGPDLKDLKFRLVRETKLNSMARIINIGKALSCIAGNGSLEFRVHDDMIEHNNRAFGVTVKDGIVSVGEIRDSDLVIDIAFLTDLIVNGTDQRKLRTAMPDLHEEAKRSILSLFPLRKAANLEHF